MAFHVGQHHVVQHKGRLIDAAVDAGTGSRLCKGHGIKAQDVLRARVVTLIIDYPLVLDVTHLALHGSRLHRGATPSQWQIVAVLLPGVCRFLARPVLALLMVCRAIVKPFRASKPVDREYFIIDGHLDVIVRVSPFLRTIRSLPGHHPDGGVTGRLWAPTGTPMTFMAELVGRDQRFVDGCPRYVMPMAF
eukprot:scaffold1629_cov369-Prasinococcus_capsulatus_cf.AAC.4